MITAGIKLWKIGWKWRFRDMISYLPWYNTYTCKIFQQDLIPCRTSKSTIRRFQEHINCLEQPAKWADLNPLENPWAALKNALQKQDCSSIKFIISNIKKMYTVWEWKKKTNKRPILIGRFFLSIILFPSVFKLICAILCVP